MDFSSLQTSETAVLTVVNPLTNKDLEHEGIPVTITLSGSDSKTYQEASREALSKRMDEVKVRRGGRVRLGNQDFNAEALELIVASTVSWTGIVLDSNVLECTYDNVKMMYTKFAWLSEQVDEFINNRENFLGN